MESSGILDASSPPARRSYVRTRAVFFGVIALMAVFAVTQWAELLHLISSRDQAWGIDFRGGLWPAAHAVLAGHSPYPPPHAALLKQMATPYVWPPLLALLIAPLTHLPMVAVLVGWNVVCGVGFFGGLWLLGLRNPLLLGLTLLSAPLVESLYFGQPEGLFVLLLAIAWRYRDRWPAPVAIGLLIAMKLLAWPLILWLLFTRRWRSAVWAAVAAGALLLVSWVPISFHGLTDYPSLLSADTRAFGSGRSAMGFAGLALHWGASLSSLPLIAGVLGFAAAGVIVAVARGSDMGWFTAGIAAGLLTSPLLWTHYLLVLFVPLAISCRRQAAPWLLFALFWIWPASGSFVVQALVTTAAAIAICVWAAASDRPEHAALDTSAELCQARAGR